VTSEVGARRSPRSRRLVSTPVLELGERVKILDFGIAKLGVGLTATGDRMGTPACMPPEQWKSAAKADAPADVCSFGCLVFEMCCGRPPFEAASYAEAYKQHAYDPPPRASSLAPGVPGELDQLIARMLAKSPEDRPAIRDVGAAFARIAAAHPCAFDSTAPPGPTRAEGRVDSTLQGAASSLDAPGAREDLAEGESRSPRWSAASPWRASLRSSPRATVRRPLLSSCPRPRAERPRLPVGRHHRHP